jgi:hypothetical protein
MIALVLLNDVPRSYVGGMVTFNILSEIECPALYGYMAFPVISPVKDPYEN